MLVKLMLTFPHPITLSTERLILRQWKLSDLEPFGQLNADPKVMQYFPKCLSRLDSDRFAGRLHELITQYGWGFWAVELKATNEFIGLVGLNPVYDNLPAAPCVEVGWRIAAPFWGQGYALEAAQMALYFGFNNLLLKEIVSFTSVSNQRSEQLMQRLHMQRAAQTFEHPALEPKHPLREHCLYRLSREQWQRTQRNSHYLTSSAMTIAP